MLTGCTYILGLGDWQGFNFLFLQTVIQKSLILACYMGTTVRVS